MTTTRLRNRFVSGFGLILLCALLLVVAPSLLVLGQETGDVTVNPERPAAISNERPAQEAAAREIESEPEFSADLDGRQTWTLRIGFGSPIGLAGMSLSAGQVSLQQSLQVDLVAEALSILRVEGHFDPQLDDALQSLTVYLDTDHLAGIFGDFTLSSLAGFSTQRRKTMGAQLEYTLGDLTLVGVAARLEGITESTTFLGQTAADEATFAAYAADRSWEARPYRRHIDGLYAYALDSRYVEEISTVDLYVPANVPLGAILSSFGLGFLLDTLAESPASAIENGRFKVIGEQDQTLLLTSQPHELVRSHIEDAIDAYNDEHGLKGLDRERYPFVRDSGYELEFLNAVVGYANLRVDDMEYPLQDAERNRFYDLGRTGIVEGSVVVEVSVDGGPLTPVDRPEFSGYSFAVHLAEGVLEVDFPATFFKSDESAFAARFAYTVSGGAYSLGSSVVPGTERVSINGVPIDESLYEIEYEIGLLILLEEVAESDVIYVEYERFGSGLGGGSDYARYLYGLTLSLPVSDALDVTATIQQGTDRAGSVEDPERVRTMPNRQTVGGVLGEIALEDLTGSFSLGYGMDVFPPGTSERPAAPNEVTAMAGNEEFFFVGTRNGFGVLRNEGWHAYGVSNGLSGRWVRDMAADDDRVYLGTNAGLTVVDLGGAAPFDRVANWSRYSETDGLSEPSVQAIALAGSNLWIGTDDRLFLVPVDALDDRTAWRAFVRPGGSSITALAASDSVLYIGTESDGVFARTLATGSQEQLAGTDGLRIHDLQWVDEVLAVSTDRGVRTYRDGAASAWIDRGVSIPSGTLFEGELYYGTSTGVVRASDGTRIQADWPITALGLDADGGLWAGSRADETYELLVWRLGPIAAEYARAVTGIDGRDPARFGLIASGDHTGEGFFGRASFQHEDDILSLNGDVAVITPGYRAIGEGAHLGSAGWSLHATTEPLENLTVTAFHEYERRGLAASSPYSRTRNELTLAGDLGPEFTASLRHESTNTNSFIAGAEASSTAFRFTLDDWFFSETLHASVSWNNSSDDDHENSFSRQRSSISASASLSAIEGLVLTATFRRPLQSVDASWTGREEWDLGADWSPEIGFGSANLSGTVDLSRPLDSPSYSTAFVADGNLRVDSFDLGAWSLTPTFDAGAEIEDGIALVHGQGILRSTLDAVSVRTTLSGELSGIGDPVMRSSAKLSLSLNYTGVEDWRPTLTFTTEQTSTSHENVGSTSTLDHRLIGRSRWTTETFSNNTSVSLRLRTTGNDMRFTGSFENDYDRDLTPLLATWLQGTEAARSEEGAAESPFPSALFRFRVSADTRWEKDELDADASASASLNVSLTEMWSAALTAFYLSGTQSAGGLYHSFVLELTVAVDF